MDNVTINTFFISGKFSSIVHMYMDKDIIELMKVTYFDFIKYKIYIVSFLT